jgi:hypothetical protein
MKLKLLVLVVLCGPAIGLAQTTLVIPPTTYPAGNPPVTVTNGADITTNNNAVTVSPQATVIYDSTTKVMLEPGFHASSTAIFMSTLGTLDSDGDGLPDVWERAYGLNPSNPSDAAALAAQGSGLTNLQAYQAGLYPLAFSLGAFKNAGLPAGYNLVVMTPDNRAYGVETTNYQITQVPLPQ